MPLKREPTRPPLTEREGQHMSHAAQQAGWEQKTALSGTDSCKLHDDAEDILLLHVVR